MANWHNQPVEKVLEQLQSAIQGLGKETVAALQQRYGENRIKAAKQRSKFSILLSQFKDVMIIILIVAAMISFFVGEHTDAYVIIAIILANAAIGYFQEYRAEESIRKLQQMAAQHAMVLREGQHQQVEASALVPGDVVLLEAGNIIPADGRLFEISAFKTEEAALTGESHSIEKTINIIDGEEDMLPGDQLNMVFKGTSVSNGSARMVVTATGMDTEIGKIATMLEGETLKTPLQQRLARFSKQLVVIVLVICAIIFGYGLWRGESALTIFLTALSLAVAALPEALPAVITISLANGAARMVRQKALIRRLPAVETLGSVSYICSDKTGTLTQNVMTVEQVWCADEHQELFEHALMLNNEIRFNDNDEVLGDSTEIALVHYALQKGKTKKDADTQYPLLAKLPFDSERMRMGTLHQYEDRFLLLVKGAPIKVADVLSSAYDDNKTAWLDKNKEWAKQGLRVLFFGFKVLDEKPEKITEELENELDFLGMVGMIDPPREEVIDAIRQCKTAGIQTVMITGDQPLTAHAIAQRLEIVGPGDNETLAGAELSKLSDEELGQKAEHVSVYARVSPEQKLKIVRALQQNGHFVAMTGDGVNDAPSLKQANIGVAMGITGSDVAKEASHMVLLDDNFATIVKAVKEGRKIYDNIRKFVMYVLSCNLGEILVIFFAPILGLPIPLLPIHILWINLVTDGLPGLALAAEPAEKDIMKRKPRPPKESLFAGGMMQRILITGSIMAIGGFILQFIAQGRGYALPVQQTMVFTFLCITQLGNALSVRSLRSSLFSVSFMKNPALIGTIIVTITLQFILVYTPYLQPIFKTATLSSDALFMTVLLSMSCIAVIDLTKIIHRKFFKDV